VTELTLSGHYAAASRLAASQRLRQALSRCQRILKTYPKHLRTYGVLGSIYLQAGLHSVAEDLFQRLLSADPENAPAYASLGAIYNQRGQLAEALWQLERAWELAPAREEYAREVRADLQRLYRQRGDAPGRLKPTRAALARTYMRGGLYDHAVTELRTLLVELPDRYDLQVMLAEALWQQGLPDEAARVCQGLLGQLPNCLKANLILGQIWLDGDRDEEARALLQRAQALDPENLVAQELFGGRSPLPPRVVRLPFEEDDAPPLDLPYLQADEPTEPADAPQQAV
jgi:predicted Zn-dependent protease